MNYRIKFLLIFINIAAFIGCASNFLDNTTQPNTTILIDKPKVTFDLKKLPQKINIFTFDTNSRQEIMLFAGIIFFCVFFSSCHASSNGMWHDRFGNLLLLYFARICIIWIVFPSQKGKQLVSIELLFDGDG